MTTAAGDPQIVPRQPASSSRSCAPPTGAWPTPWSPSSPTTPAASTRTQWRFFTDWCDEVGLAFPAGGAPHRGALPGRPRQFRRQHRHPAPGHVAPSPRYTSGRPRESPGRDPGVRASLKGWGRRLWPGPSARPAPSPPTSSP